MADIGRALHTYLQSKQSVTDLVKTRGYPETLPQDDPGKPPALPAYTYDVQNGEPVHHMGGSSGLRNSKVLFVTYDLTRESAVRVGEAIRNVLDGYRGVAGSVAVRRCHLADIATDYQPPADGSDQGRYVQTLVFEVHHVEAKPTFV